MSDIVIKAENLGKKYTIGHQATNGRYLALRDVVMQNARSFWRVTKDLVRGKPIILGDDLEEIWALKDVSFDIRRGEAVGIIGRNGAGKSTLLKILSRITEPTAGRVTIRGRVASLLEVGTGFHPELTGRENIYLNGAVLGMTRAEIKRKFDEIVDFSGVEKFLDTPVKRYSSGMYVRLAFAVAAHLEPEILLVDEVLAVGDVGFQKKCLGKMEDVSGEGRTVLFVSHNMAAVANLCERSILLENGSIRDNGATREVTETYLSSIQNLTAKDLSEREDRKGKGEIRFTQIRFLNGRYEIIDKAITGGQLIIRLFYEVNSTKESAFRNCRMSVAVSSRSSVCFLASTELVRTDELVLSESGYVDCIVSDLPLGKGVYLLTAFVESNSIVQDMVQAAAELSVMDGDFYGTGRNYPPGWEGRGVLVKHRWEW